MITKLLRFIIKRFQNTNGHCRDDEKTERNGHCY